MTKLTSEQLRARADAFIKAHSDEYETWVRYHFPEMSFHGRLLQAAMWREYAMTWHGRPTRTGIDRKWCEKIGRWTYKECLRRSRVNVYLARRLRRSTLTPEPATISDGDVREETLTVLTDVEHFLCRLSLDRADTLLAHVRALMDLTKLAPTQRPVLSEEEIAKIIKQELWYGHEGQIRGHNAAARAILAAGPVVPVDAQPNEEVDCEVCNGKGQCYSALMHPYMCMGCHGSGKVAAPPTPQKPVECPVCLDICAVPGCPCNLPQKPDDETVVLLRDCRDMLRGRPKHSPIRALYERIDAILAKADAKP